MEYLHKGGVMICFLLYQMNLSISRNNCLTRQITCLKISFPISGFHPSLTLNLTEQKFQFRQAINTYCSLYFVDVFAFTPTSYVILIVILCQILSLMPFEMFQLKPSRFFSRRKHMFMCKR